MRLDDKMKRLKQLHNNTAQVKDESMTDTLLDLANYAVMSVMELNKTKVILVPHDLRTDRVEQF
ncbi:nucleotide modification associated domain-containing protein [Cytobacillus sp. Hm23]